MAQKLNINRNDYLWLEKASVIDKSFVDLSSVTLGNLTRMEKCILLRRRRELTQEQLAKEVGISRYWLNRSEVYGLDCEPLFAFWGV